MAASQAELESVTMDLTANAFECFAEDISTMFDTEVNVQQMDYGEGTIADIKDNYKKLAAICSVRSEGSLNGNFHVVFDKEGLFTLAGTFVMQPEKVIAGNRKTGTEVEANEIGDAIGEVGNLMVGSWDRVFREEMDGHGHFVQSGTFVGNPWTKPKESIGIDKDEPLVLIQYQMTVEPLDVFNCTAIYPKSIFVASAAIQAAKEGGSEQAQETPAEEASAEVAQDSAPVQESPAEQQAEPVQEQQAEQAPQEQPEAAEQPAPQPQPAEQAPPPAPAPQPQPQATGPVTDAIRQMTHTSNVPVGTPMDLGALKELSAKDIMRQGACWAAPDETVEQVVAKMQQYDTGYVMVGEENQLQGIISKSDVRGAMSPYLQNMFSKWRGPMDLATLQIKAKWIMSRPVRTVRPDASMYNIMRAICEHGGRCMPVVDENTQVLGTVTVFDLLRAILNGTDGSSVGQNPTDPPLT